MKLTILVIVALLSLQAIVRCQDSTINNLNPNPVCTRFTTSVTYSNCGGSQGDPCLKCESCNSGSPNGWKKLSDFTAAI